MPAADGIGRPRSSFQLPPCSSSTSSSPHQRRTVSNVLDFGSDIHAGPHDRRDPRTTPMAIDLPGCRPGPPPGATRLGVPITITDLNGLVTANRVCASDKRHRPSQMLSRTRKRAAETAARDAPLSYSQRFGAGTGELVHRFTRKRRRTSTTSWRLQGAFPGHEHHQPGPLRCVHRHANVNETNLPSAPSLC
jgi:hypothetical protein